MAKPVNPDVKQVALEVLGDMFDHALSEVQFWSYLYDVDVNYKHMPTDEAKAYKADVRNFIEAILEGEITMRKPSR